VVSIDVHPSKSHAVLFQNCVTYPVSLGKQRHLRRHADAYRCCVNSLIGTVLVRLVCGSTCRRNRFPSVLLQPFADGKLGEKASGSAEPLLNAVKTGVQIVSRSATACKRSVFSSLDSGICGGSQPTLSAALAACGLKRVAKVARVHETGLRLTISGPFFIDGLVGVGCRWMVVGPH
jgi:hypothetical protein